MTRIKIKGFKIFKDRHGKPRCYHRRTGTPVDLVKNSIGSVGFIAECERVAALEKKLEVRPGGLHSLISAYRAHPAFQDLAPRTRSDYSGVFNYLQPIGNTPLVWFTAGRVVKIRDKAAVDRGRRFGNYVGQVLSVLFAWGRERDYLKDNPAWKIKKIKRPKNIPQANRPWADREREAVWAALPPHMKLPFALMAYTGMDLPDALKLARNAVVDNKIRLPRIKTGVEISLPLPGPVAAAIPEAPSHFAITLCANSFGKPWQANGSGYRASWRKIKTSLESSGAVEPGLTLKGLRHTVGTILAEIGMDERTIADYLAQESPEMARHYSRRADKSRKNAKTVLKFEKELNRRATKAVKPA